MQKNKMNMIALAGAFYLCLFVGSASAQEMNVKGLDPSFFKIPNLANSPGAESRKNTVDYFLDAALSRYFMPPVYFSAAPPPQPQSKDKSDVVRLNDADDLDQYYPWLKPLLYPEKLPRFAAVSKWSAPVRIAFDIPNDLKPYNLPQYRGKALSAHERWQYIKDDSAGIRSFVHASIGAPYDLNNAENLAAKKLSEIEIKKIIPELRELTNIDISFVSDKPDDPSNIGNMRVVFINKERWWGENNYKTGPQNQVPPQSSFKGLMELSFPGASQFSVNAPHQVDGYFISNGENEIEFSVCYIMSANDATTIKRLLRECLIRSLGLPGIIGTRYNSFLSPWNDARLEGSESRKKIDKVLDAETSNLSEPDRFFLRTLYLPAIKPGMDFIDIYKVLNVQ